MRTPATLKLFVNTANCLAFIFLLALFGCKKANNDLPVDGPANAAQKSIADVLFAADPAPDSKITQLSADKKVQRILTPITGNGNLKLFKYILIELGGEGNVLKIGRLLSKTKIDEANNLFSLPLANDGSLNYFDANASEHSGSKILMKTKGTKVTSESVADDFKDETASNYAPVCTGGYCIDHWWVTYDTNTGQIYTIEYLGSDCYEGQCNGSGGGGGGGGSTPPPTCAELTAVTEAMANQTYPASDLRVITESNLTPETRQYTYQWICLINYGGWGLLSTEKGVHKKVALHGPTAWEWVSLTHVNVVKEGLTIGGSVEHSEVATPEVGKYNAGMTLAINLKFNVACVPIATIEKNHTAQRIFNVNEAPASQY